jgi:hypothetical protein
VLGTDAVYEWSTDNFGSVIPGENAASLVTTAAATTTYYVRISGPAPCADVSATVQSVTVTVLDSSIAPTALTADFTTVCSSANEVELTATGGSLGFDASYVLYDEDPEVNLAAVPVATNGTGVFTVFPASTTTYFVRIESGAPCNQLSATASETVTVNAGGVAPDSLVADPTAVCSTSPSVDLEVFGGVLGFGGQFMLYDGDPLTTGTKLDSNGTGLFTRTIGATTTFYVRIEADGPCPFTDAVSVTVNYNVASVGATSVDISDLFPCYNESVTLTQVGGTLGTGAEWQWATDAAFTNVLGTTTSDDFNTNVLTSLTYYVRAINGTAPCPATTASALGTLDNIQAGTSSDNPLASSTEVTSQCPIDDFEWHYFIDDNGNTVAAINSRGQDLGFVTWEVTVDGSPTIFANPNNAVCNGAQQERHVGRSYRVVADNQPSDSVIIRIFMTPAEYTAFKAFNDAQDAQYVNCWGSTNTPGDLMVTAFFAEDAGDPGEGIVPSRIVYGVGAGPDGSHQYEFFMDPAFVGPRLDPNGRFDSDGTDFYIHNAGGRSAILPVELTSFTGTYTEAGNLLNWTTASEFNNDRFEVLRSTDAVNFTQIGIVAGNGTTNEPQAYSFLDTDVTSGVYYYQLRQVDFDGTSELSRIVSVVVPGAERFDVGLFYPNPTTNRASVNITLPQETRVVFSLYSIDGKQVISQVYTLDQGNQRIDIDVASMPAGSYIGIFQTDKETINRKLIKQD